MNSDTPHPSRPDADRVICCGDCEHAINLHSGDLSELCTGTHDTGQACNCARTPNDIAAGIMERALDRISRLAIEKSKLRALVEEHAVMDWIDREGTRMLVAAVLAAAETLRAAAPDRGDLALPAALRAALELPGVARCAQRAEDGPARERRGGN